jgi:hypothetical protein
MSAEGVLKAELNRVFGPGLPASKPALPKPYWVEIGPNFNKCRSASASWMGLCPDNDVIGGKFLWGGHTQGQVALQPPPFVWLRNT